MRLRRQRRRKKGQSLVETMIGFLILIPIGLIAVNLVTLISCSQSNEQWAELAARAAASTGNEQNAIQAAEDALTDCEINNVVQSIQIDEMKFDVGTQQVSVSTMMEVKMPVPLPWFSQVTCHASSVQPIVSTPAPR